MFDSIKVLFSFDELLSALAKKFPFTYCQMLFAEVLLTFLFLNHRVLKDLQASQECQETLE